MWGGDPNCEHEWIPQKLYHDNLRFRDPNHIASVRNNRNPLVYDDPNVTAYVCNKCGAWKGQLGLEPDYQMYIDHLMMVTKELKRVLKRSGTVFWIMGDTYNGIKKGKTDKKVSDYVKDAQQGLIKRANPEIPLKSLIGIPMRFAIRMIDDG